MNPISLVGGIIMVSRKWEGLVFHRLVYVFCEVLFVMCIAYGMLVFLEDQKFAEAILSAVSQCFTRCQPELRQCLPLGSPVNTFVCWAVHIYVACLIPGESVVLLHGNKTGSVYDSRDVVVIFFYMSEEP